MATSFENPWSWHQFPNLGYIRSVLTQHQLQPIYNEIEEIQQDFSSAIPHNAYLAGNIKKEFELIKTHEHIKNIISPLCVNYINQFDYFTKEINLNKDKFQKLDLYKTWVNFQEKHEFNPLHDHSGIISFVIWLKIPFTNQNEINNFSNLNMREKDLRSGNFTFVYTNALGNINSFDIPVDSSWDGTVAVFPSAMKHLVYPFYTSDSYRITVSGNFYLSK